MQSHVHKSLPAAGQQQSGVLLSIPVVPVLAGPDSMIVRLALAAHSKVVGAMLDMGLQQGEAAFKQHITLQVRTADTDTAVLPRCCQHIWCWHDAQQAVHVAAKPAPALEQAPPDFIVSSACLHILCCCEAVLQALLLLSKAVYAYLLSTGGSGPRECRTGVDTVPAGHHLLCT